MMCFHGLAEPKSGVLDGEMMCFRESAERESGVFDGAKWRFQEPAGQSRPRVIPWPGFPCFREGGFRV
jgi:hypothetical protein